MILLEELQYKLSSIYSTTNIIGISSIIAYGALMGATPE